MTTAEQRLLPGAPPPAGGPLPGRVLAEEVEVITADLGDQWLKPVSSDGAPAGHPP